MKISKLFHWLYAILMFLPFGLILFNVLASFESGQVIDFSTWRDYFSHFDFNLLSSTVGGVFSYLVFDIFGFGADFGNIIYLFLTYWTCVSIIWLVFDVFMYVPLLVHRWIDKAKLE